MNLPRPLIELDEGCRSKKYQDPLGSWTIGIGHLIRESVPPCPGVQEFQNAAHLPWNDDWTPDSINAQYEADVQANCSWLWTTPWWPACNEARQAALNDMAFNLGPERMQKFSTFLGLIATQDWKAAANDLMNNTEVAKQLPVRYYRLARIILDGEMQT